MQLRRKGQGAAVRSRNDSGNGVGSQQRQARGQATVAEAEATQGQTTINQKTVAIAAETVLVMAEMVSAVAVAAAMGTAAMVATTRQPCQGSSYGGANMAPTVAEGGGHLLYGTYYYLHNSRGTDVITIVRRMAKHKSVLPKHKVFWQSRKCFQSVGAIC